MHKAKFHASQTNLDAHIYAYPHPYHNASVELQTWEIAALQHGTGEVVWKHRKFSCETCGFQFQVDGGTFTWEG